VIAVVVAWVDDGAVLFVYGEGDVSRRDLEIDEKQRHAPKARYKEVSAGTAASLLFQSRAGRLQEPA